MTILTESTDQTRTPRRIQRKRTKGWRMPEGAVYVGRPSRWGNPWRVVSEQGYRWLDGPDGTVRPSVRVRPGRAGQEQLATLHAEAVTLFEVGSRFVWPPASELAGHDLACWCPLDQPCHADVLLALANSGERP